MNKNILYGLGFMGAVASPFASAVALDTSGATAELANVGLAVPVVGAAILAVLGLMAAWKLARGLFA